MPPDACLIVLFALFTVTAYLLWVAGRLPFFRKLLGVLAVASLISSVVLHDLEMARIASSEGEVTLDPPASAGGAGPGA